MSHCAPVWNRELLFVGGFVARAVYELEMQDMKAYWNELVASKKPGEPLDPDVRKWFYDRAGHNLQFFAFHPSTPSAVVSSEMRTAFFDCVTRGQTFPVVSSAGIRSALDVRMPDATFSSFLRDLPVFPEELMDRSRSMVAALRARGMLKDITFTDVLKELRERPLSSEEMVACLQWWISTSQRESDRIDRYSSRTIKRRGSDCWLIGQWRRTDHTITRNPDVHQFTKRRYSYGWTAP
jgi:hypothetical protein